jgi:hypothetical protein
MQTINTVLHSYRFDTSKEGDRAAYAALTARLSAEGYTAWVNDLSRSSYATDKAGWKFSEKVGQLGEQTIGLETEHLFSNQWNSAPILPQFEEGARLFNWVDYKYPNKDIKQGYWLDQTDEMREVLRNTHKCGYCGKQEPAQKGYVFCPHCTDSEYLKQSDLHLTRMVSVCDTDKPRAPLTQAENDYLLPIYKKAQIEGSTECGRARIAKARTDIENELKKSNSDAQEKHDAALWVLNTIPGLYSDWIFYNHTRKHCFGWRTALDTALADALLDVISEFPFQYEIKCADGRTLSN